MRGLRLGVQKIETYRVAFSVRVPWIFFYAPTFLYISWLYNAISLNF
jgi:hypothetical protein